MPDWKRVVREALAHLNLEPGREESIVEELALHLTEQYSEMLRNGVAEEEARRKILEDLHGRNLDAELRPVFEPQPLSIAPGSNEAGAFFTGIEPIQTLRQE
jgi:hypothetical protein